MKSSTILLIVFFLTVCCRPMSPQQAASKPQKCGCGSIR